MKIGIITLLGNNYGNRLQNYAVQEILKKYGEVYTVVHEKRAPVLQRRNNLRKLNPIHIKKAVDSRLLNVYHLSNRKMNTLSRVVCFLRHKKEITQALRDRDKTFKNFDKQYIQYESEKIHLLGDDEKLWIKSYDGWVCGSDQIWNPNYPTATRNAFLQFAQTERRVSFAASIGLADVKAMPENYKKWIEEIPYLSVREEAAANIVKKLTGREANILLDPTMILPLEYWKKMADRTECRLPAKFALCYFLGIREKDYDNYITQQLKAKGLQSVELLNAEYPQYLSFGPEQMIRAIRNAEMVFVDSFHGAVFSILFHKQFVVFERKEEGMTMNSRLQTLLKKFDLENRVFNPEHIEGLSEPIDYSKVDEIIDAERNKAKVFLDNAMKEIAQLE